MSLENRDVRMRTAAIGFGYSQGEHQTESRDKERAKERRSLKEYNTGLLVKDLMTIDYQLVGSSVFSPSSVSQNSDSGETAFRGLSDPIAQGNLSGRTKRERVIEIESIHS